MSKFVWSFSALECFEQCPQKFYGKYILKIKEPPSEALIKGRAIHNALEKFLKQGAVDPAIEKFMPLAQAVLQNAKGKKLATEQKIGLNGIMEPVGFFDDNVWGRGAADFIILDYPNTFLGDWKDGKGDKPWSYVEKYEKPTQLAILALFIFKHYPRVNKVTSCNIYLEHGRFGKVYTFTRDQEAALWGAIMPKIEALERAIASSQYVKVPGPLCGYCPQKSCQHNRS